MLDLAAEAVHDLLEGRLGGPAAGAAEPPTADDERIDPASLVALLSETREGGAPGRRPTAPPVGVKTQEALQVAL